MCSTDILPVLPGPEVDRNYLANFLAQPDMVEFAASRAAGANLPRLSPTELARFEVPLPPIEEQRRIAAILDQADGLRAKRREALALLDDLTQSIFIDMFGSISDRVRFSDLIERGPSNGMYKPADAYAADGIPIVRIDSFYNGEIALGPLKRVRVSEIEIARFGLEVGDLLINRVNSLEYLGKSAHIRSLSEATVYESNMMRLRLRPQWSTEFVNCWLQTADARQQVQGRAKRAVNQASINQKDVQGLLLPKASAEDQEKFARIAAVIRQLSGAQVRQLRELDGAFTSIQSRAFSGRL